MDYFKIWCAAGKPDTGPLLDKKKNDKWLFKSHNKEDKNMEKNSVSNELNDWVIKKNKYAFWKSWSCEFNSKRRLPKL